MENVSFIRKYDYKYFVRYIHQLQCQYYTSANKKHSKIIPQFHRKEYFNINNSTY